MQTRYYDPETSRFISQDSTDFADPETGRFISQDSTDYADPETINGLNLYAYCGNNPVMGYEPTGEIDWGVVWTCIVGILSLGALVVGGFLVFTGVGVGAGLTLIGAGSGGLLNLASSAIVQGVSNGWDNIDWGIVALNSAAGFLKGALFASPLGLVATGISIGLVTGAQSVSTDLYQNDGNWDKVNWGKAVTLAVFDGVVSGVGKYFLNNTRLQSKFINSLPWVKDAAIAADMGGRASYMALWQLFMFGQFLYQKGLNIITSAIRNLINFLINNFWK